MRTRSSKELNKEEENSAAMGLNELPDQRRKSKGKIAQKSAEATVGNGDSNGKSNDGEKAAAAMVDNGSSNGSGVDAQNADGDEPATMPKNGAQEDDDDDGEPDEKKYTEEEAVKAKETADDGRRDYVTGRLIEANKALSGACVVLTGFYGEKHRECAEPLYNYGRVLLDLCRKEPDIVANALKDVPGVENSNDVGENGDGTQGKEGDDEAKKDEKEENLDVNEIREKVVKAFDVNAKALEKAKARFEQQSKEGGASAKVSDAVFDDIVASEELNNDDTKLGEADDAAGVDGGDDAADKKEATEEATDESGDEEDKLPEEVPNMQLAFEVLDLSRIILEEHDDVASRQLLADVRLALAEHAMEDNRFDDAVKELEICIALQKGVLEPDDRRIATSYYQMALAYNQNEKYEEAVAHFEKSIELLELRLKNLEEKLPTFTEEKEINECKTEIDDLKAVIEDMKGRIEDAVDSRRDGEEAKRIMTEAAAEKKVTGESAVDAQPANDVTHLVRKGAKRPDTFNGEQQAAKKAKIDEVDQESKGEDKSGKKDVMEEGTKNGTVEEVEMNEVKEDEEN